MENRKALDTFDTLKMKVIMDKTKYVIVTRSYNGNGAPRVNINSSNIEFRYVRNFGYLKSFWKRQIQTTNEIKDDLAIGNSCYVAIQLIIPSKYLK